jgi:hypothetical protein
MSAPDDRDRDDQTTQPASDPPDPPDAPPPGPGDADKDDFDPDDGGLDEVDLRDMLRGALRPPQGAVAPSLLRGVQGRLRARSKGKFYGDGWSTAQSPRSTYLVTSIIMLAVIAMVFLVLIPWGLGP